jgi:murein DD-endopeptidase MepM/ murein hydrolase activator NlpD
VSAIAGVVVQADAGEGNLAIKDDRGLILYYGHLDSILAGIRIGAPVRRGQWVGMLGRRGASGNSSHLHVGVYFSDADLAADRLSRNLNL